MKPYLTSWQTTVGGLIALSGVFGLLFHSIDLSTAVVLIGIGATWVGVASKAAALGSNVPTTDLPPALRDPQSQKDVGLNPPEQNPTILKGIEAEEAAKHVAP